MKRKIILKKSIGKPLNRNISPVDLESIICDEVHDMLVDESIISGVGGKCRVKYNRMEDRAIILEGNREIASGMVDVKIRSGESAGIDMDYVLLELNDFEDSVGDLVDRCST